MAAREGHIANKDNLKQQEHQAAQDLTAGNVAKAHHDKRYLGLPVTVHKGRADILELVGNGQRTLLDSAADVREEMADGPGDAGEEGADFVTDLLALRQAKVFQIAVMFHQITPLK